MLKLTQDEVEQKQKDLPAKVRRAIQHSMAEGRVSSYPSPLTHLTVPRLAFCSLTEGAEH